MPAPEIMIQRITLDVTKDTLRSALNQVIRHHHALRTAFTYARGWQAHLRAAPPEAAVIDPCPMLDAALAAQMDPLNGRHVAAAIDGRDVIIGVHHLVMDASSWAGFLADLKAVLRNEALAVHPVQLRTWAQTLAAQPSPDWQPYLSEAPQNALGARRGWEEHHHQLPLPAIWTGRENGAGGLQNILLTALSGALQCLDLQGSVIVDVEDIGRSHETLELTDVSGFFTALVPLALPLGARSPAAVAAALRARPASGAAAAWQLAEQGGSGADILFNLLDAEQTGAITLWQSPQAERRHKLVVNCILGQNDLSVEWGFASGTAEDLRRLADAFAEALAALSQSAPAQPRMTAATTPANLDKLSKLLTLKGGAA